MTILIQEIPGLRKRAKNSKKQRKGEQWGDKASYKLNQ